MDFLDELFPPDSALGRLFDLDRDGHVSMEEAILADQLFLQDSSCRDDSLFEDDPEEDDPDLDDDDDEEYLDF